MKVDVIASLPHYLEHMLPIYDRLPADMKGDIHELKYPVDPPARHRIGMVAGWQDVQTLRPHHRMIYVEHGAGQVYTGDEKSALQPGYSASGGFRHGGVELFIAPSPTVASRWKTAPAHAVGCPKLDQYVRMEPVRQQSVCFAWHWDSGVSPEARTALPHYVAALPAVVARFQAAGVTVYGHGHPRWEGSIDRVLADCGMTVLRSEREVFTKAAALIVDNSSIGMEFLALRRPVVWMNAPWYRRDIDHGGRFWTWTHGVPTVNSPDDLMAFPIESLFDGSEPTVATEHAVAATYGTVDGQAGQRAADLIAQYFRNQ